MSSLITTFLTMTDAERDTYITTLLLNNPSDSKKLKALLFLRRVLNNDRAKIQDYNTTVAKADATIRQKISDLLATQPNIFEDLIPPEYPVSFDFQTGKQSKWKLNASGVSQLQSLLGSSVNNLWFLMPQSKVSFEPQGSPPSSVILKTVTQSYEYGVFCMLLSDADQPQADTKTYAYLTTASSAGSNYWSCVLIKFSDFDPTSMPVSSLPTGNIPICVCANGMPSIKSNVAWAATDYGISGSSPAISRRITNALELF